MPEMKKKIKYIVTYTGKVFEYLNPKSGMVCIEDIAHALANICRYTGHVSSFYSVAQHCVLMALNPELPGNPLVKLLHDAGEAYIGDLASPWKGLLIVNIPERIQVNSSLQTVKQFEQRIQEVIGETLGVDLNPSPEIKLSDIRMFWTEIRDLMPEMLEPFDWGPPKIEPVKERIVPWTSRHAEKAFLECYKKLKGD